MRKGALLRTHSDRYMRRSPVNNAPPTKNSTQVGLALRWHPHLHFLATTRNCLPKSGQVNFNFKYRRNIHTGGCPPRDIV
jgi:hypothetical protein